MNKKVEVVDDIVYIHGKDGKDAVIVDDTVYLMDATFPHTSMNLWDLGKNDFEQQMDEIRKFQKVYLTRFFR